jgi:hypothetical protein
MRAQRIVPPPTAFSRTSRKQPREQSGDHLAFIRGLPCLVTGRTDGVEAAHIRYGDILFGKRETGKGEKPSDCWVVPLHRDRHRDQHLHGDERDWWRRLGIDPLQVALALHRISGDNELGANIVREARERRT